MTTKNIITSTRFDHPVNMVFQKQFLKTLSPKLLYTLLAEQVDMPKNSGDTTKWRRMARFSAQTTPLTETGLPTPLLASKTDISATVVSYGFWLKLSKLLKMTGLGSEQQAFVDELRNARDLTQDTISRDVIAGASSQSTCSNGSGTATKLNDTDIDAIVQTLLNNNCEPAYPMISAGTGQGTSPIDECFPVIAHTSAWTTLKKVTGYVNVSEYAKTTSVLPGEVGAIGKTRWCLTSNGYYDGSTYYYATFLSKGAYGNVKISGTDEPLIYKSPEQTGDPLNSYATLGTYFTQVAKILDEIRLHNLRFTI